jgi:hypothetical protein
MILRSSLKKKKKQAKIVKYREVFCEKWVKRLQIVQKWISVETLHATSSFSSSAIRNKKDVTCYVSTKNKKQCKNREIS